MTENSSQTFHVIGAGLAGLAAATALVTQGHRVVVHEAARMAGGRCRSYFDDALGLTIDNGNHLLLACNHHAMDFLARIGVPDALEGPDSCVFDFADLTTGTRWRLHPNDGRVPWWIFSESRRVPDTKVSDYLAGISMLRASKSATIADVMATSGILWDRLWNPVLLSVLNTETATASASLAGAIVRESLGAGGRAARPRVAREGLGPAFIEPALAKLGDLGAQVRFGARLRTLQFDGTRISALGFGDSDIVLGPQDCIILAVPAQIATSLVPDLVAPDAFRSILNVHFAALPPAGQPLLVGIIGGMSEWLFAFHDRLSVTISAADRFMEMGRDEIAQKVWQEVAALTGLTGPLPRWQVVKEKRATFAATPEQDAKRPHAPTRWSNLWLAGDWTQTGLPATIEGAIRSGDLAAKLAVQSLGAGDRRPQA